MVLGTDYTPNMFAEIAEKRMDAFVAGIGPAGAPSRIRAAEAVAPCSSVLDIGCGPGVFLTTLQLHPGPDGVPLERYCGVDAVEAMLPWRGLSTAQAPGIAAEYHLTRAEDLPFRDGEFQGVVIRHLLEHLEDPYPALREAARVCSRVLVLVFSQWPRGGGLSILTDTHLKAPRWAHPASLLRAVIHKGGLPDIVEENYSPDRRGRLSVREAIWSCTVDHWLEYGTKHGTLFPT